MTAPSLCGWRVGANTKGRRAWSRALLLGWLVAISTLACGGAEQAPVLAARKFADAARRGDAAALVPLLDHDTQARLTTAAEDASDQVGGRRTIAPSEMLEVSGVDPTWMVASVKLVELEDERARVKVESTDGREVELALQKEADGWKVILPPPGAGASAGTARGLEDLKARGGAPAPEL